MKSTLLGKQRYVQMELSPISYTCRSFKQIKIIVYFYSYIFYLDYSLCNMITVRAFRQNVREPRKWTPRSHVEEETGKKKTFTDSWWLHFDFGVAGPIQNKSDHTPNWLQNRRNIRNSPLWPLGRVISRLAASLGSSQSRWLLGSSWPLGDLSRGKCK